MVDGLTMTEQELRAISLRNIAKATDHPITVQDLKPAMDRVVAEWRKSQRSKRT